MDEQKTFKCPVCDKEFEQEQSMLQHKNDAHATKTESAKPRKPLRISKTWAVFIGIFVLIIAGGTYWALTPHASLSIDGISCNSLEQTVSHTHAHIDIFINQLQYPIPAGIGIIQGVCLFWIHVHDTSGII